MDKDTEFYLKLFDDFPALIWRSGLDAKCNYFNKAWLAFTGRTLQQEIGDGWIEGVHLDDLDWCVTTYLNAFKKRQPFDMDYRLKRHDGEYRWIKDMGRPFFGLDGVFMGYIGSCYDITEAREYSKKMEYLAVHDQLTGVSNRLALKGAMDRAAARAARGRPSALLYIDIDYFKKVNDKFGHDVGDRVLREITETLSLWLRKEDMLARVGGDEFAALLEGQEIAEAVKAAERMRLAIDGYTEADWDFTLSISIGVAQIDGQATGDAVLGMGDNAMYKAKNTGRNKIIVAEGDKK